MHGLRQQSYLAGCVVYAIQQNTCSSWQSTIQNAATGFVGGTAEYLPFRDAALRPCRLHNDAILLFPSLDCRPGPSTTLNFYHNSA